jgi:hypothetical protein
VLGLFAVTGLALPGDPETFAESPLGVLQKTTVLMPLAMFPLIGLLWALRMWAFRHHVRAPGPIRLVSFDDATGPGSSSESPGARAAPADGVARGQQQEAAAPTGDGATPAVTAASTTRLSMHLRSRLMELRLPVPSALPGARSSMDFVELLGTTNVDFKQPFAAAGNVLRLIRPTHAYELKATILQREEQPCRGVALELTSLPGGAAVFRTYWDDSWEHALDRVASGVGARVVPHSRHAERGPWCSWRRKTLPEDLFLAYQRAQRRTQHRRYDEALLEYHNALRLDPVNEHLRHDLGHLQEGRALYLDALLTYRSIITSLDERPIAGLDRAAIRARQRIRILTRYRSTILLGFGERLARQWLPPPRGRPTRRSDELDQLRDRLRPILRELYLDFGGRPVGSSAHDITLLGLDVPAEGDGRTIGFDRLLSNTIDRRPRPTAVEGLQKRALPTPEQIKRARQRWREEDSRAREVRKAQLRLLFQLFATHEVGHLLKEIRDKDLERLDTGLSRTALDLLPTWASLRTEHARILLRRQLGESIPDDAWPPSSKRIRELWGASISRGRSLSKRLDESCVFIDHYNAACTYSIALNHEHGEDLSEQARGDLAGAAVQELRRALNVAASAAIAANWDWIASKDPDLAGLRTQPEFRAFESERLPSSSPAPRRPADIADLLASQHSVRLVKRCARVFEDLWHRRTELAGRTDAHMALRWWKEERRGWELLCSLATHHRHWQTRVEVVSAVRKLAEAYGLPPVRFAQARYADEPVSADVAAIDKVAGRFVWFANGRLAALADVLDNDGEPLPGFAAWSGYFKSLDHDGKALDEEVRRLLAVQQAGAWANVRHFMEQEIDDDEAAKAMLRASMQTLASLVEREAVTAAARR